MAEITGFADSAFMDSPVSVPSATKGAELRKVIVGASLGTVIEWYDFFIYAILAATLSRQFFTGIDPTSAFIVTLLSFSAGTAIRPLGALVFGRYGDLLGRKRTFLVTIVMMGASTFFIGVLPGYASWGVASAFLLVGLRLLQGFALGGEYGGAVIYVAEHAPANRRGFFTSWIQITTPLGQVLAMVVILLVQNATSVADFAAWGWRVPFLLSIILLVVSYWIRSSTHESPVYQAMQQQGQGTKTPLKEMFGQWRNLRVLLIALFGLAAGQALVINVGMTYSFFFLTQTLRMNFGLVNALLATALVITAPFFVLFGALSDRVGRKWIIMAGLLLATASYRPIFQGLLHYGNPALEAALHTSPVVVAADPAQCSVQFNPTGTARFTSSCDIAKAFLTRSGVSYGGEALPPGSVAQVRIGTVSVPSFDGTSLSPAEFASKAQAANTAFTAAITKAGYPAAADSAQVNNVAVTALLALMMLFATMVYGPMAALLVEMFPPRIRFSSVSTAYNIGNGWFGGFTSPIAFALAATTGDLFAGLWYCIGITALTLVVGLIFLKPPAISQLTQTA